MRSSIWGGPEKGGDPKSAAPIDHPSKVGNAVTGPGGTVTDAEEATDMECCNTNMDIDGLD